MNINEFLAEFKQFTNNLKNIIPLTGNDIAAISVSSVKENFDVGGRPASWTPSKRAIRENNKTLIDSGALYNSINGSVQDKAVTIASDIPYASDMNDQREFMLLQETDIDAIEEVIWKVLGL